MSNTKTASSPPRSQYPVTVSQLREVGLFGALSDHVLEHLVATFKPFSVEPGTYIFKEEEPARDFYILLAGEAEVLKKSRSGRETRVAILGPHDCFGEMSVIDMQPRSATVRALSPSHVLKVTTEDMDGLYRFDLKSYTLIVLNIARDLSRRLRVTDRLLADFTASVLDEYVSTQSNARQRPKDPG